MKCLGICVPRHIFIKDGTGLVLHHFLVKVSHRNSFRDFAVDCIYADTFLSHCVTVTNSHSVVFQCLMVYCDTEWSTDRILTTVSLSDCILLFVSATEVKLQLVHDSLSLLWQTIFLQQWKHCAFDRCQCWWQVKNHTLVSAF